MCGLAGPRRPGTRKLARKDQSWDEMMIREKPDDISQEERSKSAAETAARDVKVDRWQEPETGSARESDTQGERQTDRRPRESERPKGRGTQRHRSSPQRGRGAEMGPRDGETETQGQRTHTTDQKAAEKAREKKVSRREWWRTGRAQRSGRGAGSGLVKAARSGEIAARIAELHKTPPARPAAAPAPISSLIAARAGYAFKCYLIGLRRSWGPERPPPPPRTLRTSVFRVTDCSTPPPSTFPPPDGAP